MSTNVRVKKITTASKNGAGRSNVYHDIFEGKGDEATLVSSTLVGKLRKTRGTPGYDAFVMTASGSRTPLGNFGTRSGAAHAARKSYMDATGATTTPKATPAAKTPAATDDQAARDKRNARRRELRAAKAAA